MHKCSKFRWDKADLGPYYYDTWAKLSVINLAVASQGNPVAGADISPEFIDDVA
jgi:hypothetical protein